MLATIKHNQRTVSYFIFLPHKRYNSMLPSALSAFFCPKLTLYGQEPLMWFICTVWIWIWFNPNPVNIHWLNTQPSTHWFSPCFCPSDQCDGRPRWDSGRPGQPWSDQPHHPYQAPNRQNNFPLSHQLRVCAPSQRITAGDPPWAWRISRQGSGLLCQHRGDRTRAQHGSGVNGGRRTALQPHTAERRGGHRTEVNGKFPEISVMWNKSGSRCRKI